MQILTIKTIITAKPVNKPHLPAITNFAIIANETLATTLLYKNCHKRYENLSFIKLKNRKLFF